MARPHSPSQGNKGATSRRPSSGWSRISAHSSSVGFPDLFKMCGCTESLPTSCSRADQRSRSRSAVGRCNSSAIKSVKARTRSEWPRVLRSWRLMEAASARISSATATGTELLAPVPFELRSRSLVSPARHATFSRLGAWSGNSIVILNSAANGRSRRQSRSDAKKATVDDASTTAHQRMCSSSPCPRDRVRPATAAVATDTANGARMAAPDTTAPNTGWERHLSFRVTEPY